MKSAIVANWSSVYSPYSSSSDRTQSSNRGAISAQGVSLACEDAVTLARCLRDEPDVPRALADYADLRRDRVDRVTRWGAKMGQAKTVGPLARVARDLVVPRFLALGAKPKAMDKQAWLFSHHIDWDHGPTPSHA
jgi:FAD-dependent urate hydroxylase